VSRYVPASNVRMALATRGGFGVAAILRKSGEGEQQKGRST
jgi:hypothetical protein